MAGSFYRHHWDTVGKDVISMAKHFFTHCELPISMNATNLVLLPKKEQPSSINNYRPIALCNYKKTKDGFFLVKHDMEKAYDKLDWHFLKAVLSNWGFHDTFVGWIMNIKVARRATLTTHLLFADDIVLFRNASEKEAKTLMKCMDIICSWSGEKVSKPKYVVHFSKGAPNAKRMALAEFFQMSRAKGDRSHLGLPLLISRSREKDLNFILNKVNGHVQGWKEKILSKAKRSTLVQVVWSSLVSYVTASGPMPCALHESVDKALRSFWWGDTANKRKVHTLSWGKLCAPKLSGSLGFRTSKANTKAFMVKRAWEILVGKKGIWHDLVGAKYLKGENILSYVNKPNDSHLSKGIIRSMDLLQKGLYRRIGNGNSTSIWF
ncbi:uncharacterized protein LOC133779800 [Humulus lupulus]|uniref:uncharacterized protein LOC133779800 n=1 Tax=Humulus lupulus TaxID=3486 RepID=UPI002B409EFD|nr:uncharacterized protein LOC133779800 [Humulus lupulus]